MFWYATIEKDSLRDGEFFTKPQSLTRLGLYLIEAKRPRMGAQDAKPIIISIRIPEKKMYQVAGILSTDSAFSGDNHENQFGTLFTEACEAVGAQAEYSGFETSIISIEEDKFKQF